jgi:uncharacterized protein (DUF58 family)
MDTTEILKKVRKIEIKTKGLSKHIFSGEYHSAFKGRGMSFSEVREYQYGDDVRNIDWNVTAKTGDAHVKVFEEERELTVMLIVDVSRSGLFGTQTQFKSEMILEMAAVIAFSASTNNDKVGAILFSDKIEKYIPPKKGRTNILRIIRELIYLENRGEGTDLNLALEYFNNVQKKRSIAFVLSDFMTDNYSNALTIASRRHDLVGLHIFDEREQELPNVGLIKVQDAESGRTRLVDTSISKVRESYADNFAQRVSSVKDSFNRNGSDILSIGTHQDYVKLLLQFFKKRSR